ncbi:MAG: lppS [Pseudonocardiales bacterium]|nr:lppS [Pseudonocardiales bacterium]
MTRPRRRFGPALRCAVLAATTTAIALGLASCTSSSKPNSAPASVSVVTVTAPASTPSPTPTPTPTPLGAPVHVSSLEGDGQVYGVGMPLVIRFSVAPTDKKAFEAAAKVTVDGAPAGGAWYWEQPYADSPTEVHYRPENYWKANSKIHVDLAVDKLSAGVGLNFDNSLMLDYSIGADHYSVVEGLTMSVYQDKVLIKTIPVSLGAAKTPTYSGTKIVMQKDNPVRMVGNGYDELVAYSVRMTSSGEYIHAAPWNSRIGQASTSNGCTNLTNEDAAWYYTWAQLGDPVQYNIPGDVMPSWDGYGDWNLTWPIWQGGGKL